MPWRNVFALCLVLVLYFLIGFLAAGLGSVSLFLNLVGLLSAQSILFLKHALGKQNTNCS